MRVTNVVLSLLSLAIPLVTQLQPSISIPSLNMPGFRHLCNCCWNFLLTRWHLSDLLKQFQQIRRKKCFLLPGMEKCSISLFFFLRRKLKGLPREAVESVTGGFQDPTGQSIGNLNRRLSRCLPRSLPASVVLWFYELWQLDNVMAMSFRKLVLEMHHWR